MTRPDYRQREAIRQRLKARAEPCAICGRPIDYSLDWWTDPKDGKRKRHPLSFEYDHAEPIAVGGHPTSMGNAQPAHRICNQRKGDGRRGRQASRGARRGPDTPQPGEIPTSRAW